MKNKSKLIIIIVIAFLVLGISLVTRSYFKNSNYEYVHPKRGELTEAIYGLGKVKARRKYDVKVGVLTSAEEIYVSEGQEVQKGEKLVKFSDSVVIRAPFNGTVVSVAFNEKETVMPQVTGISLIDLNDKYIEVSIEQEGALRVKKGQTSVVVFESLRGERFQGKVTTIFPKQDEFLAHIDVEGLHNHVLPGMTADVSVVVGEQKNALLVPIAGISNGQIILQRNGKELKIPIKIGGTDGDWAEVLEGDIQLTDLVLLKTK